MPQPTTSSTSSAILPQQERTEPSGRRRCRHGTKSSLQRELTNQKICHVLDLATMDALHGALLEPWKRNDVAAQKSATEEVRRHSIFAQLLADPMTRQAFTKPRGYPGDADLIDFIYGSEVSGAGLNAASPAGRAVYAYNVETIACQGVRNRRDYIAKVIDDIAERKP